MLDQIREALEEARPVDDGPKMAMNERGAVPRPPFGFDELNAACAAARDRGHQEGWQSGATAARQTAGLQARQAGIFGETLGAVAGLNAAVDLVKRRIAAVPDGQGRLVETLDEIHADLLAGLGEVEEHGLHGEREPRTTGGAEAFLRSSRV